MRFKYLIIIFCLLFIFNINCVFAVECPDDQLCNPLGESSPQTLIGKVINAALGVVGSLALVMFIYGGLVWMTAAGNNL